MSVTRGPGKQSAAEEWASLTVEGSLSGTVDALEDHVVLNVKLVTGLGNVDAGKQEIHLHSGDDSLHNGHERGRYGLESVSTRI